VSRGAVGGTVTLCIFHSLTGPKAYLDHLVVAREWRRRGIGRALVQHAIEEARAAGASRIDLTAGQPASSVGTRSTNRSVFGRDTKLSAQHRRTETPGLTEIDGQTAALYGPEIPTDWWIDRRVEDPHRPRRSRPGWRPARARECGDATKAPPASSSRSRRGNRHS